MYNQTIILFEPCFWWHHHVNVWLVSAKETLVYSELWCLSYKSSIYGFDCLDILLNRWKSCSIIVAFTSYKVLFSGDKLLFIFFNNTVNYIFIQQWITLLRSCRQLVDISTVIRSLITFHMYGLLTFIFGRWYHS